jgi:hypothetical protein
MKLNFYTIIAIVFAILSAIIYFSVQTMAMHFTLLMGGNFLLMLIAVASFFVSTKNTGNASPRGFVNKMMAGSIVRLFACLIGISAVIFYFKNTLPHVNIYFLMIMYVIYSFVENYYLMKLSKQSK